MMKFKTLIKEAHEINKKRLRELKESDLGSFIRGYAEGYKDAYLKKPNKYK